LVLAEILERMKTNPPSELSSEELMQKKANSYNETSGDLQGYDCHLCKNKGHIAIVKDGYEVMRQCTCISIRASMRNIEKSGIAGQLDRCTFDSFEVTEEWQRQAKSKAERFVDSYPHSEWLFMGGQVGAGKTHLCTAVVGKFLTMGEAARYMLWRDESPVLKAVVNSADEYLAAMEPLKTADVLYIDDLFKTERGKFPTEADIKLAHELLNYRYINRNLVTIISSELLVDDLIDIDEAIGSRIFELSKTNFCVQIGYSRDKNYRLK